MLSIILIIFTKFIHEFILIRRSCCTSKLKLTITCKLLISNNTENIFPAHDICWSRSGSEESFLFHVVIQSPGWQDLYYLEFHNSLIYCVPARKTCVYFQCSVSETLHIISVCNLLLRTRYIIAAASAASPA